MKMKIKNINLLQKNLNFIPIMSKQKHYFKKKLK